MKYGVRGTQYGVHSAGCGVRGAGCGVDHEFDHGSGSGSHARAWELGRTLRVPSGEIPLPGALTYRVRHGIPTGQRCVTRFPAVLGHPQARLATSCSWVYTN